MSNPILRNKVADYIDVSDTATPEFVLCGVGFNTLNESPGAQMDTKTYVCEDQSSTTIKSYQPTFPFDTDMIMDEDAVNKIYEIGRDKKTGAAAMIGYVRVDLFDPATTPATGYNARKYTVSVEVASIEGEAGGVMKMTGNFHAYGAPVAGTFDPATKAFTATA